MLSNLPPEFITTATWFWTTFGEDIAKGSYQALKGAAGEVWNKVEWNLESHKYRQRIYDLHSTIRILGNPNPVQLEGIFTDINILEKPTAFLRYNIDRLVENQKEVGKSLTVNSDVKRINAVKLIRQENKLFLLGKPGAGKTTLLKYVTLIAAQGNIDKIPIFVSLRDWAESSSTLIEFIQLQFEICSFPDSRVFIEEILLKKGKTVILFDGLDEVREETGQRQKTIQEINDFTNKYYENKYIITCRVATTDYSFPKFRYVELADFNKRQITSFAHKFYSDFPEKAQSFIHEINKPENAGLLELAQTPILLSLLCINFDDSLSFPIRKADMYEEAIVALLKKWDASRNIKRDEIYKDLSPIRRQQLYSQIAAEYFEKGEIFFREHDIAEKITEFLGKLSDINAKDVDGFTILKAMEFQHGILIERANRIHSFSHLTFQEYFTARYVTDTLSQREFTGLMEHFSEDRWREVFLLTASLLPDADKFISSFLSAMNKLLLEKKDDGTVKNLLLWSESQSKSQPDAEHPVVARINNMNLAILLIYLQSPDRDISSSFRNAIVSSSKLSNYIQKRQNVDLDLFSEDIRPVFSLVSDLSKILGFFSLSKDIEQLYLESFFEGVPRKSEHEISFETQKIVKTHKELNLNLNLTNANVLKLNSYLKATILLSECLKVCAISNRKEIESNLLLP